MKLFPHLVLAPLVAGRLSQQLLQPQAVAEPSWHFNYSSSAPHYFASVHGLLQQWTNTFFPNGHSVVPCEIPAFTKLYHGRMDGEVPPSPEWVAFDAEMSYGIMGASRNTHLLTYQTTRLTKCVYFDGESAALMGTGQLDSQMLHLYGNVTGPINQNPFRGLFGEYDRATGLCDWLERKNLRGDGWGYQGVVRMNAGFEMIWCDFSSASIRLVSHMNVTAPLLGKADEDSGPGDRSPAHSSELKKRVEEVPNDGQTSTSYYPLPPSRTRTDRVTGPTEPGVPPNWRMPFERSLREPFLKSQGWNWFLSSTRHYGLSGLGSLVGENRVKLLMCGALNYYAPPFQSAASARSVIEQKSLNLTSDGCWKGPGSGATRKEGLESLTRRRRAHTLSEISPEDAALMVANSERALANLITVSPECSGFDWSLVTNEIVDTYANPLVSLLTILQLFPSIEPTNVTAVRDWMKEFRDETHSLLVPFLQYPEEQHGGSVWKRRGVVWRDTYARCRYHHTRLLDPEEGIRLNPEEQTLKWAVEETTSNICNVTVSVGVEVEQIWLKHLNTPPGRDKEESDDTVIEDLEDIVLTWTQELEELMAWLGWADMWARCPEVCAWDEKCFIPMWPLLARSPFPGPGGGGGRYGPPPGRGPPGDHRGPPDGGGRGPPGDGRDGGRGPSIDGLDWDMLMMENPHPPGRRRFGDEADLWQPKCVKVDYIMN